MRHTGRPNSSQERQRQQQQIREQWQPHQLMGAWQQQRNRQHQEVLPPTDQDLARHTGRSSSGMHYRANAYHYQQPDQYTSFEVVGRDLRGERSCMGCVGWTVLILLVVAALLIL